MAARVNETQFHVIRRFSAVALHRSSEIIHIDDCHIDVLSVAIVYFLVPFSCGQLNRS